MRDAETLYRFHNKGKKAAKRDDDRFHQHDRKGHMTISSSAATTGSAVVRLCTARVELKLEKFRL